jgi:hypothetical protein
MMKILDWPLALIAIGLCPTRVRDVEGRNVRLSRSAITIIAMSREWPGAFLRRYLSRGLDKWYFMCGLVVISSTLTYIVSATVDGSWTNQHIAASLLLGGMAITWWFTHGQVMRREIQAAWIRTLTRLRRCAACGYPWASTTTDKSKCSECGASWCV